MNALKNMHTVDRRLRSAVVLSFSMSLLTACAAPQLSNGKYLSPYSVEKENPVLLRIDNEREITAQDLITRLEKSNVLRAGGVLPWDEARDTLENILRDSLVSLAVDTFTLQTDRGAYADFVTVYENLLKQEFISEVVFPQISVDSSEADSFYTARPEMFTYFSQVRLAHIVLSRAGYRNEEDSLYYRSMPDEELDSLIYRRLRLLREQITDSLSFQEAAELYSLDRNSGKRGGALGWIERENLHPEIAVELFDSTTALHEALGPIQSRDGAHLFYIYDRHFEGVPPLNEARLAQATNILADMKAQRVLNHIFDSLQLEHPVVYNDSALLLWPGEASPELWVAWAEGIDTVRYARFQREIDGLRASRSLSLDPTLSQRRYLTMAIVNIHHVLRMCRELGVTDLPRVRDQRRRYHADFARSVISRRNSGADYTPSEEDISEYYSAHIGDFVLEKQFHVQQIILEDSLHAEFVRALAESGYDFLD
ncbi:MAG: peptidylprolyl isomerase, partial [Candidatus Zixiibacteriota bacterium]